MKGGLSYLWIIVAALALGVLFALLSTDKDESGGSPFSRTPRIDQTAAVVTEISKIAQFTTACFYEDKIVRKTKYRGIERGLLRIMPIDSVEAATIIFIAHSNVKAGYDLSRLTMDDISFEGDTLVMRLPPARILDVIVNPSDWELYHRRGSWSHEEIRELQNRALEEIRGEAVAGGLLQKAETSGEERLRTLLESLGFNNIRFTHSPILIKQMLP